jgi:hypothetical protein
MTTRHLYHSPRVLSGLGGLVLAVTVGLAGCAGYVDVGGYDAEYAPVPVGVEAYPAYVYRGATVYDVDGRYYARHEGRWVRYRNAPPEVARWHSDRERGRAERQRQR